MAKVDEFAEENDISVEYAQLIWDRVLEDQERKFEELVKREEWHNYWHNNGPKPEKK